MSGFSVSRYAPKRSAWGGSPPATPSCSQARLAAPRIRHRALPHRLRPGLLRDPRPRRPHPRRPVLLPAPARPQHRHRIRPDGRHDLARPPHPARRRPDPLRPLGAPGRRRAHPARRHRQRCPRLDHHRRRFLAAAVRIHQDHHHPRHGDGPRRPRRRGRPGAPRPPDRRQGAGPRAPPDGDRHGNAGPGLRHGHGRHRARRAPRLRGVEPLGLRPPHHAASPEP